MTGFPAIKRRDHHPRTPDESLIFAGIERWIHSGWRGDEMPVQTVTSLRKLIALGQAAEQMIEMREREQGL